MRFLSAPLIIVSASYAFTSAAAAATVQPRTGPETVAHCGPWNHKGCFVDTPQRTLPTQLDVWGNNTVEFCIDQCDRKGFTYAAVEYGDQCFCGNTFDPSTPHSTGCNMTCAANPNEICGGTYASNVYEKALPVTTCGLWRDVPHIPTNSMTVEKCLDGCAQSGYTCAGLEYGQECWCGDCKATDFKYGSYDQCYMGCTGNGRQLCGGGEGEGWEMIYTMGGGPSGGGSGGSGGSGGGTSGGGSGGSGGGSGGGSSGGSSGGSGGSGGGGSGGSGGGGSSGGGTGDGPWTPCGCYQAPLLGLLKILPFEVEVEVALNVGLCQAACLAKGYHACALEGGDTCRCASSADIFLKLILGLLRLPLDKCNAKCPGNAEETCGGRGALQAYVYHA